MSQSMEERVRALLHHDHVEGDTWFCCSQCKVDCDDDRRWDCSDDDRRGKPCDCGLDALVRELASLLREVRREALELAAKDACMYCGGRALGCEAVPEGPNEAGNWWHKSYHPHLDPDPGVLCRSTAIHARLRALISSEEPAESCVCHLGSVCGSACAKGRHHAGCPGER